MYEIDGLSIGVAVAVGDYPSGADFLALYKGKKLPAGGGGDPSAPLIRHQRPSC